MKSQYAYTCELMGIRHEAALSRRSDMWKSFAAASACHALAVTLTGSVLAARPANLVPAFQQGESAVALTLILAKPAPPATPESVEVALLEPASQVKVDVEKPEAAKQPEPEDDAADADALTKGVESAPSLLAEIRPRYPLGSRMRGEEGIVTLRARVDAEGMPVAVEVAESSGYAGLDNAALRALQRTRFVSAQKDGKAVAGETTVRIRFRLVD